MDKFKLASDKLKASQYLSPPSAPHRDVFKVAVYIYFTLVDHSKAMIRPITSQEFLNVHPKIG